MMNIREELLQFMGEGGRRKGKVSRASIAFIQQFTHGMEAIRVRLAFPPRRQNVCKLKKNFFVSSVLRTERYG